MTHLERGISLLAFPVGFFIGVAAIGFVELLSLGIVGVVVAVILMLGFGALFFADWLMDKLFGRFLQSGVFGQADAQAKRLVARSEARIRHASRKIGALGAVCGVLAGLSFGIERVMQLAGPILDIW